MRLVRRKVHTPIVQVGAAILLAVSLQSWGAVSSRPTCAAEGNHAGLVIRFSPMAESHRSWCLQFTPESISGMDALRLTGLPIVTKSFGSEGEYVCKIADVGTDAADCPAKDGSYWGYWRMTSQGWRHSGIGASGARVRCGNLEGWAWLQGGTGPAPEAASFSMICPSAACKAASSSISPSSPAGGVTEGSARGDPVPESGLPADVSASSAEPGVPVRAGGGTTNGQPAGAGSSLASETNRDGGNGPPVPAPAAATETPVARGKTVAAANKPGASQPANAAERTANSAGRRSRWGLYGGLAGVILLLGSARATLFWKLRRPKT